MRTVILEDIGGGQRLVVSENSHHMVEVRAEGVGDEVATLFLNPRAAIALSKALADLAEEAKASGAKARLLLSRERQYEGQFYKTQPDPPISTIGPGEHDQEDSH